MTAHPGDGQSRNVPALMLAAIGVVFGDIGTSPLYALKETFAGHHAMALDKANILGVLSLMFWAITIIVSFKYVIIIMRADNRGEGGSLSLLALVSRAAEGHGRLPIIVSSLGIFAAALFYGDSIITPAISVLSAVEGLRIAAPNLEQWVVPLTIAILVVLFAIQSHGTDLVGKLFGPVMLVWFGTLAVLGVKNMALAPSVLSALSPHHAIALIFREGWTAFLALGSVVLCVTGAEALYTDMGHFGRLPIRLAWYMFVLPALILNYFGQGALLISDPAAIANPFFKLAPTAMALPLVILATLATVIASQAVISGAFSVTRQAIQLGLLPRMEIIHTSKDEMGQIYLPFVNWLLLLLVIALVLGFQTSSNLAAAYGVAVTGTMVIDALLVGTVMLLIWKWNPRKVKIMVGGFLVVDLAFFLANSIKIPDGGWFPLIAGGLLFTVMATWKHGRQRLLAKLRAEAFPVEDFLASLSDRVPRVPGTAVFLTGTSEGVPIALLHNMKHNKIIHERVVLLTVQVEERPFVPEADRLEHRLLAPNFHRLFLRYGFMESPNIPKALAHARSDQLGFFYEPMSVSYFVSRETLIPLPKQGWADKRDQVFAALARMATSAMDYFHLPSNRVVELGSQIEI
ncbi:potassium transport protein Kup [Paramagnetospirillum marisnigri]|uniref:Probable potassium transport system protein Kup n=1 Tax=Paramagnetospirillum marisnigri TaxID=1285242 RepID=A0A178MU54_9PROT|nr:potassium transporter Kup [Paramagnetospirillum marisnigri]OAN52163.1 potassium transport protein Kup [Paramagnetospirillum marisnigri]